MIPLKNNYDIKEEKIVIMKEGNITSSNLNEKEIKEIKKNNQDYINIKKLFQEKLIQEYYRTSNVSE